MDSEKAIKYILKRLEQELPKEMYYHGVEHTKYVLKSAEKLLIELKNEEDKLLFLTACAYHDAGFLVNYFDNEQFAVEIAKNELIKFGYSDFQIQKISDMILATQITTIPNNLLEKLICDADYFYFGGKNYFKIANYLRAELAVFANKTYTEKEWIATQIKFLEKHKYYTNTAKKLRNEGKQNVLKKLKKQLLLVS